MNNVIRLNKYCVQTLEEFRNILVSNYKEMNLSLDAEMWENATYSELLYRYMYIMNNNDTI